MWRNVDENWERRKDYLIRSLFHDIPLLSPVPENDESCSQTSWSSVLEPTRRVSPEPTRRLSPLRPVSPLPPLIIEKMPNRHDDPPEFYEQLEKKIKKIYRKMFFDDEASEGDLPESYMDTCSVEEYEDEEKNSESSASSIIFENNRSWFLRKESNTTTNHCTSHLTNTNTSSSSDDSNVNDGDLSDEDNDGVSEAQPQATSPSSVNGETQNTVGSNKNKSDLSDKENLPPDFEEQSNGTSSSVNGETEVTVADVIVHTNNNFDDIESSKHFDEYRSPIIQLTSRSIVIHDPEREPHHDSELSSQNSADSELGDELVSQAENLRSSRTNVSQAESLRSSLTNVSTKSVELMRRQEVISPSWSLQDDQETETSDRHSNTIGFKRKTSFEIYAVPRESWIQNAEEDFTLSGEVAHELHNVSNVLSPIPLSYFNRASVESENLAATSRIDFGVPALKRKRYEDQSIQTSTIECNHNVNWDYLKCNFFAGTPKILNLCSCDDHKCK